MESFQIERAFSVSIHVQNTPYSYMRPSLIYVPYASKKYNAEILTY